MTPEDTFTSVNPDYVHEQETGFLDPNRDRVRNVFRMSARQKWAIKPTSVSKQPSPGGVLSPY